VVAQLIKELKKLIKLARSQGWEVRITGGNHVEWKPPDKSKPKIYSGNTISDGARGFHNVKAILRKNGLDV